MKPVHLLIFCLVLLASNSYGIDETKFQSSIKTLLSKQEVDASRLMATLALEKSADRRAVPYLISAINDETYSHHFSAIHALGSLGGPEALKFLNTLWMELESKNIQNLSDADLHFIKSQKAFIAGALFKLGDDQHVGYIYELVMSNDKTLRYNAASALGMVNTKRSKEILIDILKNDRMDLPRCGAVSALAEHGNSSDFIEIRKIIGDNELLKGCFEDSLKK